VIAVAADVLLAYLIEGDSDRAKRAASLIEGEIDEGRPIYISALALTRVASELSETYGRSPSEVHRVIRAILTCSQLRVEARDSAFNAVVAYGEHSGTYPDMLAFFAAFEAGCSHVFSFDERMRYRCSQP